MLKVYASVFICLTTKAVHFDLCTNMSTKAFMATLPHFTNRRGIPNVVYSDNRTNFVCARQEIQELQLFVESNSTKSAISHYATQENIQWHHIPPRAPHFGGLWEAAVRSMKTLLRKIIAPHQLRYVCKQSSTQGPSHHFMELRCPKVTT